MELQTLHFYRLYFEGGCLYLFVNFEVMEYRYNDLCFSYLIPMHIIKSIIFVSYRQVNSLLAYGGYTWMASLVPNFLKVPLWIMHFGSYKF